MVDKLGKKEETFWTRRCCYGNLTVHKPAFEGSAALPDIYT